MLFDHVAVGGGVIGFNSTKTIIDKIISNKKITRKIFNFAIIDKNINNIIGGIAYNPELSSYGYFNNPIRLSPISFVKYIKNNKNFIKQLIFHLNNNGGLVDEIWKYKSLNNISSKKSEQFDELYLPRASYGIWQKHRLIQLLENVKKFNIKNKKNILINIFFIEAEIKKIDFNKIKFTKIIPIKIGNLYDVKYIKKSSKIIFNNNLKKINNLYSLNCTISLGLNPPKKYYFKRTFDNNNYIWDFYSEGSTKHLIKLINSYIKKNKNKKIIKIYFIGFKAGLLESLPELNQLIKKNKIKIDLTAFSSSLETLQKAELNNNKQYKFVFLKKNQILKVKKASEIISLIKKEFENAIKTKFSKYHVWTKILKENILIKLINNLKINEKKKYNLNYFGTLRNMTRFTYPYPLEVKDHMIKNQDLKLIQCKILRIESHKNHILLITKNKKYMGDIVVNVSGPLPTNKINSEVEIIQNLKKDFIECDNLGFKVKRDFSILKQDNIFLPGTLASGYNPNRITILKAILNNSEISSHAIYKKILNKDKKYFVYDYYLEKLKNFKNINITKGGITASRQFFLDLTNNNNNISNIFNSSAIKIVIDGKAGAGKSTIGGVLGQMFNTILIDTGFIFKVTSSKLYSKGIDKKNLESININHCVSIITKLTIKDLTKKYLNNKNLIPITTYLAKNKIIRKAFNKKIKVFSKLYNSFIFTGRDTGVMIFKKEKNVLKFFLNVNDHICALRKHRQLNKLKQKTYYKDTIIRNNQDKMNLIKCNESIELSNNTNNYVSTIESMLDHIIINNKQWNI